MKPPRTSPCWLIARCPYTEHVGVRTHQPRGRFGLTCQASMARSTAAFTVRS